MSALKIYDVLKESKMEEQSDNCATGAGNAAPYIVGL